MICSQTLGGMATDPEVSAGQAPASPVFDSYGRLSWNPTTRELEKIETQHGDNETTIKRHGGAVGEKLDDGLSAWKIGVRRPGFERLLERASSGASQGIAVWHVDRLFRQPRDLERLIDLADAGFRVISSHGSRDLSNPDDRYILRIEVAHAARSSDDTSRRIKRRNEVFRERGRTTGGRPGFGFPRRDQAWKPGPGESEQDRPNVPAERVEAERRALREAVDDLLAGLTNQSAVAREWNEAGLLSSTGVPWESPSVRETLMRPTRAWSRRPTETRSTTPACPTSSARRSVRSPTWSLSGAGNTQVNRSRRAGLHPALAGHRQATSRGPAGQGDLLPVQGRSSSAHPAGDR
jgi:site-specific DNA recombinase